VCESVCARVYVCEGECVCVRGRESLCVSVCETVREKVCDRDCVRVFVCESVRE
jgi:hypothetical protein